MLNKSLVLIALLFYAVSVELSQRTPYFVWLPLSIVATIAYFVGINRLKSRSNCSIPLVLWLGLTVLTICKPNIMFSPTLKSLTAGISAQQVLGKQNSEWRLILMWAWLAVMTVAAINPIFFPNAEDLR